MTKKTSILEELRERLLDLSLRNNLLNYHPSTARSIEIIDEHIGEVYSILVLKEKEMKFYPTEKGSASPEEKNLWKYPIFTKNPKHTDLLLNTPYTEVDLRKRLYSLQTKSKTVFEEQGYPVLYLALGFIEWNDAAAKGLKAPLILIPVILNKQKIKDNYTLSWSGEDPIISPTLAAKLAESGIIIPEFGHPETPEAIQTYFETIGALIEPKKWKVLPDIILDLFSFKKYVMYKDLDGASWGTEFTIEDSPLVKSIFAPVSTADDRNLDVPVKSSDFSNIMDADSSQLAVIAEARTGKNLVVEGPPGTGKSQTIANMIAEMLAAGKSVAFVVRKGALSYETKVTYANGYSMKREEIIQHIVKVSGTDPIVSTTGKASRELFETREANDEGHQYDFLTVGSMGHASSIAMGVAINKPDKKIWCIDGDGAVLMHMGSMALMGANKLKNMVHIVINNGAHETVGGMDTVADSIDLSGVAKACGYPKVVCVDNFEDLDKELGLAKSRDELSFIEVKCSIGARDDLGRPTTTALENKIAFMNNLTN